MTEQSRPLELETTPRQAVGANPYELLGEKVGEVRDEVVSHHIRDAAIDVLTNQENPHIAGLDERNRQILAMEPHKQKQVDRIAGEGSYDTALEQARSEIKANVSNKVDERLNDTAAFWGVDETLEAEPQPKPKPETLPKKPQPAEQMDESNSSQTTPNEQVDEGINADEKPAYRPIDKAWQRTLWPRDTMLPNSNEVPMLPEDQDKARRILETFYWEDRRKYEPAKRIPEWKKVQTEAAEAVLGEIGESVIGMDVGIKLNPGEDVWRTGKVTRIRLTDDGRPMLQTDQEGYKIINTNGREVIEKVHLEVPLDKNYIDLRPSQQSKTEVQDIPIVERVSLKESVLKPSRWMGQLLLKGVGLRPLGERWPGELAEEEDEPSYHQLQLF